MEEYTLERWIGFQTSTRKLKCVLAVIRWEVCAARLGNFPFLYVSLLAQDTNSGGCYVHKDI